MNYYSITQYPIKIYGLSVAEGQKFWRLPSHMQGKIPKYDFLGKRAAGGRVRFCTDSKTISVRMTLAQANEDINIPLSGSAGADIYLGKGKACSFLGYIAPDRHTTEEISVEKSFSLGGKMETVTVNLPRNDHLIAMEIGIEENARLAEAPEYSVSAPIVFYGSSITEGGCASRAGNAYTSIVCRWLDADYYNYGFSGSARGEAVFAEYIASIPEMSAFVYDYDHNAQTAEELEKTHGGFFRTIREAHPGLPILIMTRPDVDKNPEDSEARKQIAYRTYIQAREAGDQKVWFLDGGDFFGQSGRAECTVDGTHPNALGFMRMAEKIYPVLEEMLSP